MQNRVSSWRRVIKKGLDRPAGRTLLAALGSVWITVVRREPCFVHWKDGAWIHHFRGATIPDRQIAGPLPLKDFMSGWRELYCYEYMPNRGDVVFDVGAGVGNATLLFSRLVGPEGRVVALEAHPGTYELLDRLCRLNKLTNVIPLHVAASSGEGELVISDLPEPDRNTVLALNEGIRVPALPLDAVARDLGITHVDFIKMNIEGAEQLAIQGMTWLAERTRHITIACHDFKDSQDAASPGSERLRTKGLVQEFLRKRGFRVTMNPSALEPWARDYVYGVNERA